MMKTQPQTRQFRVLAILLVGILSIFSMQASADERGAIYNTQIHIGSDGLAIQQPMISQTEILKTLTKAHLLLSKQSKKAEKIIAENNTGNNMAIAAILPGGLIYLAYKRSKVSSAKTELLDVNHQIALLDKDAVTLYQPVYQPAKQPFIVARYP